MPDHTRKIFQNRRISSEQLEVILNELIPLVRNCYNTDSYFNIVFIYVLEKIVLENSGKKNGALLESEVLNQLLHYLQEDRQQSAEFPKTMTFLRKKHMHYNI